MIAAVVIDGCFLRGTFVFVRVSISAMQDESTDMNICMRAAVVVAAVDSVVVVELFWPSPPKRQ